MGEGCDVASFIVGGMNYLFCRRWGGDRSMDNNIRTKVLIADATGHTELELTKAETMEFIGENQNAWVFAGNRLVQPNELVAADWAEVGTIQVMPPLVGGQN